MSLHALEFQGYQANKSIGRPVLIEKSSDEKGADLFTMEFESFPLDSKADYRLHLHTQPLQIIYDAVCLFPFDIRLRMSFVQGNNQSIDAMLFTWSSSWFTEVCESVTRGTTLGIDWFQFESGSLFDLSRYQRTHGFSSQWEFEENQRSRSSSSTSIGLLHPSWPWNTHRVRPTPSLLWTFYWIPLVLRRFFVLTWVNSPSLISRIIVPNRNQHLKNPRKKKKAKRSSKMLPSVLSVSSPWWLTAVILFQNTFVDPQPYCPLQAQLTEFQLLFCTPSKCPEWSLLC